MKLVTWLLYRLKLFIKFSVKFSIISLILLILFANFYSYSSLTKVVYSLEWLLVHTPLVQNGELVIPPIISIAFQHLHGFKILFSRASSYIYDDGYPEFEGKYHWNRNELACCQSKKELFHGQEKDPKLKCYVSRSLLMHIKTEVLNIDPPVVKYHDFLPKTHVDNFIQETDRMRMYQSKILVKDSLDRDIWQDSLIVNGTFVPHHFSGPIVKSFNYMQARIPAFSLHRAEQFHVKKYRPGGHYAPHLDFLIVNPEQQFGNRIATFMVILKPADIGGGTVFPNAGINFQPKVGDAILWLNMNPNYDFAQGSFHGACPVLSGIKIGVTLWIRSVGQEVRIPCPLKEGLPFDYKALTHPTWKDQSFWSYAQCPWQKGTKQCPSAKAKQYWPI
ncbi:2OG-Fe(II) oxygenase superfamily domain-containing protein [Ditylenchus destructor]|uniref:2OG-Fe(II) oxygenase superfamily domain-containing protein n=1 Tax=Ditylenchus destructor TaxID=166010 RepID=A0AAD4MR02_9BILA|nr:2OG-Fe(II) oxygenase superfamily domain-containing protein [Ditylenchus destructor]